MSKQVKMFMVFVGVVILLLQACSMPQEPTYKAPKEVVNLSIQKSYANSVSTPLPIDIRNIIADSRGNIWVGGRYGVTKINDGKFQLVLFDSTSINSYLNDVRSMVADSSGIVWFGCYGGLVKYLDGKFTIYSKEKNNLPFNGVTALSLDMDGYLLIATTWSDIYKYDGNKFELIGDFGPYIYYIGFDRERNLYLQSDYLYLTYDNRNYYKYDFSNSSLSKITSASTDQYGNIWAVTSIEGYVRLYKNIYQPYLWTDMGHKTGYSGYSLTKDYQDRLIVYNTTQISIYENNSWSPYLLSSNDMYYSLKGCAMDKDGNFWFADSYSIYTTKK